MTTRDEREDAGAPPFDDRELASRWLKTLTRLARATVHAIRGASGAMAIHAELLAGTMGGSDEPHRERQRRYLVVLEEERQRLHQVAETCLGHVTVPDPRRATFDLADLTVRAVTLSRPYADECGAALDFERPPGPVRASGRPDVVRGILLDVLIEALDATTPTRRVGVVVGLTAGRARVSVWRSETLPLPAGLVSDWRGMIERAGGGLHVTAREDGGPCVTLEFSDTMGGT